MRSIGGRSEKATTRLLPEQPDSRKLRGSVAMVDFTGEHVVVATEARWVTWQSR